MMKMLQAHTTGKELSSATTWKIARIIVYNAAGRTGLNKKFKGKSQAGTKAYSSPKSL
jgi:hypothetical protein